jgi:lipooligosaccharide transport system permease protein
VRGFTTGLVDAATPWHILYFVVMILIGMTLTTRRLKALFLN